MTSISITFTGSTMDELLGLIAAWTPGGGAGKPSAIPPAPINATKADDAAAIARVLSGVHGEQSRRLLRLLAEAALKDETVKLSAALVQDFGVTGGTAFAGMIGPVNRRAKKVMKRELIDYPSADPKARVWRIAPEDAQAVLDALAS